MNTKSIIFKTAVIYVIITLLNVSVFVLMVFENQLDLIAENAVLSSQHKGTALKYRIENIMEEGTELSRLKINQILKEAGSLDISNITLYNEEGSVFVSVENRKKTDKEEAGIEELKMINMAITKQEFEEKLFCHRIYKDNRRIELYIPFNYSLEKIAVASIDLEMKNVQKHMGYLYRQCAIIALLIVVIHIFFALAISKMFIIPLKNLITATESISKGDFNIRVPIVRQDEIGQLATSFNEMSVALQRLQDEAKGSNPLTGLPGNITIAQYIDKSLEAGGLIAVLYCDIDNFKAYNDKYGFTKGDEAIMYARECFITVAQRKDMENIFIGHEGGDDFVVICDYKYWEAYAKAFVTTFDRGVYQLYNSIDARNGFIESVDRQGKRQRFPLMSVSIAVVSNKTRPFRRHAEMIQVVAEVKKYVKSIEGSTYAIDRRKGPVSPTQQIRPS